MKKVALCISGLPRSVEHGFGNILENLIRPNNPDIFIHTWVGENEPLKNKIIELYNPKLIKFEPQRTFTNSAMELDRMMVSHGRSYSRHGFVDMLYSSWYSTQQSNLLKEQYRLEKDFIYDYVIRARFDMNFNTTVNCSQYDKNVVYVSNRPLPDHDMVDDRFAFGSNNNMNIYCGGFNLMDYFCKLRDSKDGIFCGETLVYEMLHMFNIPNSPIGNLTVYKV